MRGPQYINIYITVAIYAPKREFGFKSLPYLFIFTVGNLKERYNIEECF